MHEADRCLDSRIHEPESLLLRNAILLQCACLEEAPHVHNFWILVNDSRAAARHFVLLERAQFAPANILLRVFGI